MARPLSSPGPERPGRRRRLLLLAAGMVVGVILVLVFLAFRFAWQHSALIAPEGSYRVVDRHGHWLAEAGGPADGEYGFWPLDPVPPRVAAATLALEDGRFDTHSGVDVLAALRAFRQNITCRCVRSGASTVAMQTVRLQHPAPRRLSAKLLEALTGVVMTRRHGRDAVLAHYLRLVPYGNGSHGMAHAARYYLDKPAEDLSWAEIALLSAVPRAPDRNNPLTRSGHRNAVARAHRILDSLHNAGLIDAPDLDLARRQLPALQLQPRRTRAPGAMHAIVDLERMLIAGQAEPGTHRSTLELDTQLRVRRHAAEWLEHYRQHDSPQLSVLVVDRRTMGVRALIGSAGYLDSPSGAMDFSQVRRSPGSVIKPLIYGLALDRQIIAADTIVWDQPFQAPGVRNADRRFLGPMLPRQALANSRNVPAVNLVGQIGLETTYDFLGRAGLHDNRLPASHFGAGLAIGTLPMSLREVVQAFGVLANDGRFQPLAWFEKYDGTAVRQLLGPAASRQVSLFLADPMVRLPSFARMNALEYPFPVAVKTGTSQDLRDAWAVAYTEDHIVGVWAGRPDARNMHSELRGIATAALARTIILDLARTRSNRPGFADFPPPDGYYPVQLCLQTGLPDRGDCPEAVTEWVAGPPGHPSATPRLVSYGGPVGSNGTDGYMRIVRPTSGTVFHPNPETPPELAHIRFQVETDPAVGQVVWYVDGRPRATLPAGQDFLLPMTRGRHEVQAGLPFRPERSGPVTIRVRD